MRKFVVLVASLSLSLAIAACPSGGDDGDVAAGDGGAREGGSGGPRWIGVPGERLAPLPPQGTAMSTAFTSADQCGMCHAASDDRLRDAKGHDVSPVGTWRATPMALSARDPYYLAAFADELAARPASASAIESTCTRCHAPEGAHDLALEGKRLSFDQLTREVSPTGELSREGVACTLCHQIESTGLGTAATHTGNFSVGTQRQIFGPYQNPNPLMQAVVNFTPTYAPHVGTSALCATCHTLIVTLVDSKGVSREVAEQAPYLEWQASDYTTEGTPGPKAADCQACHMPTTDSDGQALDLPIARQPATLGKRTPFWQHEFAGANAQLSRFAASDPTWIGAPVTKEQHEAQADRAEAMLRRGAKVDVLGVTRAGEGIECQVQVRNDSGHKFPTAYPSRRAFLHVIATAPSGEVVFESGRTDAFGRLVDGAGKPLEGGGAAQAVFPHLSLVERSDQVQIYESVLGNAAGAVVHRAFDGLRYLKDNRLVPSGYNRRNSNARFIDPVGVEGDPDWGSSDLVTYRVAKAPAGTRVHVTLEYQATRPAELEALAARPTPAARRLFDFVEKVGNRPVLVASADGVAP